MAGIYEQSSTDEFEWTFDRETLGTLLVRHPWAVRLVALEAVLLAIVGVIPLVWTSDLMHAVFGMVLSTALLVALVGAVVGLYRTTRWARERLRHQLG